MLGKIDSPLDEKLKAVKWSEFRLGDLFYILSYKKRFDANKVTLVENGGHPYVVRQGSGNGQKGFIDENEIYLNDENTISFGQDTATMFYQEKPYFTGDKIKILKSKMTRFCKDNAQFFLATMRRSFSNFSWGTSSFSTDVIENQNITLPITSIGKIDFDFMESFIRELEEEHVHELEDDRVRKLTAYLNVSGFDSYELTKEEENVLKDFEKLEWGKFNVPNVFKVKNTHNILSSEIQENSGETPYLCASADNNGVCSFISHDTDLLEKGNCIFIGGKTFVVSYQEKDFYSNDSHNLALYLKDFEPTKKEQLYLATCVNKSIGHKYTWGNSVSKTKINDDVITLPVKYGNLDISCIGTFISAIQKLVIKDVVLYADRKIAATKESIEKSSK